MSDTEPYPKSEQDKILAVLRQANGNASEMQRALALAAVSDHQLLLALARPFMKGIIAHAVEHLRPRLQAKSQAVQTSASRTAAAGGKAGFVGKLIREDQLSDSNKAAHAANLKALAAAFKKKK